MMNCDIENGFQLKRKKVGGGKGKLKRFEVTRLAGNSFFMTQIMDHRMAGGGRDLWRSSPTPLPKQDHPGQAALRWVFSLQRKAPQPPGQPAPGLHHLYCKELSPHLCVLPFLVPANPLALLPSSLPSCRKGWGLFTPAAGAGLAWGQRLLAVASLSVPCLCFTSRADRDPHSACGVLSCLVPLPACLCRHLSWPSVTMQPLGS